MTWKKLRGEIDAHIEEKAQGLIESGVPEADAWQRARREFGNATLLTEQSREAGGWTWFDRLGQDLRYAFRSLRRRPVFTAAAVLSLALGIGANTAVFSLVNALLLEDIGAGDPGTLVQLVEGQQDSPAFRTAFTYPVYETLRRESKQFRHVIASFISTARPSAIVENGDPGEAHVNMVSGNFFAGLGLRARLGRVFSGDREAAAVISDRYWRSRYAASPAALGAKFRYANAEFTIVGIAAPEFRGLDRDVPADIWVPLEQALAPTDITRQRGRAWRIVARLSSPQAFASAQSETRAILPEPVALRAGGTGYSALRGTLRRPLFLLSLVVVLVLLIACANLANLLLSSGMAREREIAARWALGASRGRLIRQLLTENAVLTAFGGTCAIAVAYWIARALLTFLPPEQALALPNLTFRLDTQVLSFTLFLSIATCLMIGLLPALRTTGNRLAGFVRASSASQRNRNWASRGLLVSQIAISTALLLGAAMFVRTVQNLRGQDAGYEEPRLIVADIEWPRGYSENRRDSELEELRVRAAGLPGVERVAYSHVGQLSGFGIGDFIRLEGRVEFETEATLEQRISPGFFAVMGTRLIAGREFSNEDTATAKPVAIVNQSFARRYFRSDDPVGKRFAQEGGSRAGEMMEIVGVVQDSKWIDLRSDAPPMYYRPYSQQGGTPAVRLAMRNSGGRQSTSAGLLQLAHAIDPRMIVKNVSGFDDIVSRSILVERLIAYVSSASGLLALAIAAVGIYGVLAYQVTRRTREIGVRMALGARPKSVEWMVLRESLLLLGVGFVLGVIPAMLAAESISSMLYGLRPQDPAVIGASFAILTIAAAAAAYLPARRASRVDPMTALRHE